HDRAGFSKALQAGGKVRRFAHNAALLSFAGGDQVTHDDLPGADANTHAQGLGRLKPPDGLNESKTSPHRLLDVVLVRLRVAKVHQHSVSHVLGNKAVETANHVGNAAVVRADHLA